MPNGTASHVVNVVGTPGATIRMEATGIPVGAGRLEYTVYGYRSQEDRAGGRNPFVVNRTVYTPGSTEVVAFSVAEPAFRFSRHYARIDLATTPFEIEKVAYRLGETWAPLASWSANDLAAFEPRLEVQAEDPARPEFSWALEQGGSLGDAVSVTLEWGEYPGNVTWQILTPPDEVVVRLPELPDEFRELRPVAGEQIYPMALHRDVVGVTGFQDLSSRMITTFSSNETWVMIR